MNKGTVNFTIPVGDILTKFGGKDTIEFEGLISKQIPGLTADGLSGRLTLQSAFEDTLMARLDIVCDIDEVSDLSGKSYVREVVVNDYEGEFVLPKKMSDEHDESVMPIDADHMTINVEDFFCQAIILTEPLVKLTPDEQLSDDGYDDYEEAQGGGSITFRKV